MNTICIEIIKDLACFIAFGYGYGIGSDHLVDYIEFSEWTSIDLHISEVRTAYEWLVANGYIYEYASDPHSDSPYYYNIGLTKKAWGYIEANGIEID